MSNTKASFIGLVEIADYEQLIDRHGAVCAQLLLDEFYQRLNNWVRPGDKTQVLKNKRFLVMLLGINDDAGLQLAIAKLQRLFSRPHRLLDEPVAIKVHAGFSLHQGSAADTDQALRKARIALRQARKGDHMVQIYSADATSRLENESKLVAALELAVERGELVLYYQPKMHAGYKNVVGAEALMRWHTAEGKVLPLAHLSTWPNATMSFAL